MVEYLIAFIVGFFIGKYVLAHKPKTFIIDGGKYD